MENNSMEPMSPKNEQYLKCMALEQRWVNVWPQCIAKAWAEEDFRNKLITADAEGVRRIFKEEFDYELERHLNLTVKIADVAPDKCIDPNCDFVRFSDIIPVIEMVMYMPPVPSSPLIQARALAHHTEATQIYPFTTW
jgi:hypothetical protein